MRRGFTLIELAIVLVIIGLIIGGVLVGQDLIKAAEIRAVASDIEKYRTGVGAFQVKYNGIPGDLLSTSAAIFGLTVSVTNPGTKGEGDGNGVLENGDGVSAECSGGASNPIGLGGENTLFWRQLSDAKMIPGGYNGDGTCIDTTTFINNTAATITTLTPLIPQLRIRQTGFIHVQGDAGGNMGTNYYFIAQWTRNGGTNGYMGANPVLSPREAQGIDQKLDDGFPATGTVLSTLGAGTAPGNGGSPVTTADTRCYDNGVSPMAYATGSEDIANGIRCALCIKAGF